MRITIVRRTTQPWNLIVYQVNSLGSGLHDMRGSTLAGCRRTAAALHRRPCKCTWTSVGARVARTSLSARRLVATAGTSPCRRRGSWPRPCAKARRVGGRSWQGSRRRALSQALCQDTASGGHSGSPIRAPRGVPTITALRAVSTTESTSAIGAWRYRSRWSTCRSRSKKDDPYDQHPQVATVHLEQHVREVEPPMWLGRCVPVKV